MMKLSFIRKNKCFNAASGIRTVATRRKRLKSKPLASVSMPQAALGLLQLNYVENISFGLLSFNAASGIRTVATAIVMKAVNIYGVFQCRKRH